MSAVWIEQISNPKSDSDRMSSINFSNVSCLRGSTHFSFFKNEATSGFLFSFFHSHSLILLTL